MSKASYKLIKQKPLIVHRTSPGEWVNGRWVEGDTPQEPFTIKGHYWPTTANEKLRLPEAFRSTSTYKLHSLTELYSVREADSQSADKVEIKGVLYEVQEADHFDMGVKDHWEYLLVRKEQSAGGVT